MRKFITSILMMAFIASFSVAAQPIKWGYGDQPDGKHWSDSYPICGDGVNQSPINITSPIPANLKPLRIEYNGEITSITNNGHSINLTVSKDNQLILNGDTFTLKEITFHTPSENYIDSKQYPLSAHFINVNDLGKIAIIAVMFQNGPRPSDELTTLLQHIPTDGETHGFHADLSPANLLPRERQYYRYNGSLTTPPCTEGVRWFVMQNHKTSSKKQTDQLHKIMGSNDRPLQALNARMVLYSGN